MISFYPGPSRVNERIPRYIKDAYSQGILSINHRSEEFMGMYQRTVALLREKLEVPRDYSVFFTSSATECWEIIAQSVIDSTSYHFFNGAFGEKWFSYTNKLNALAIGYRFDMNLKLKTGELDLSAQPGVICLTQNETSNGTQIDNRQIEKLRQRYPDHLIAVDATSSMAGVFLDFKNADVWYASVQKCFGMPAGLAVMICSPQAIHKALEVNERDHYNSLPFIIEMTQKNQTTHTPNVMGIYLMMRIMESVKPIAKVHQKTVERFNGYRKLMDKLSLSHLVKNEDVRSHTVIPVVGEPTFIENVKKAAREQSIVLGNGYGEHKDTTFRIANFPAIKNSEIQTLMGFLKEYHLQGAEAKS